MLKFISPASASLLVTVFGLLTSCSSSSDGSAENGGENQRGHAGNSAAGTSEGGASNPDSDAGEGGAAAGEGGARAGEGGADDNSAGTDAGGSHAGSSSAGAAGTVNTNPTNSPCSYTVSGGKTLPEADAMYICTVNSRVYQQNGKGSFNALIGAGFSTAAGDSSTFACNMDSPTAPKAGDTWTMGSPDHPGNCELGFSQNQVATLWHAGSTPVNGEFTIKFNQVTVKNGMYHPEDVYYLYDLTITSKLKGLTEGATDVTVTGSFVNMSLPLGG